MWHCNVSGIRPEGISGIVWKLLYNAGRNLVPHSWRVHSCSVAVAALNIAWGTAVLTSDVCEQVFLAMAFFAYHLAGAAATCMTNIPFSFASRTWDCDYSCSFTVFALLFTFGCFSVLKTCALFGNTALCTSRIGTSYVAGAIATLTTDKAPSSFTIRAVCFCFNNFCSVTRTAGDMSGSFAIYAGDCCVSIINQNTCSLRGKSIKGKQENKTGGDNPFFHSRSYW